MPLRDHFRPPLARQHSWEELHGQWPGVIVGKLNSFLPPEFAAAPRVHLGSAFEIDVSAFELENPAAWRPQSPDNGGVAMAVAAPAGAMVLLDGDFPTPSEYEVLVYDVSLERRLVAAIEIVSPGNKDRPESRRAFVNKCESLLYQGIHVAIVDLVTIRSANLYRELAAQIGAALPRLEGPIYAVSLRSLRQRERWRIEGWEHELVLGRPLPTLPLWLSDNFHVLLELESTYEDACRALRIA